MLEPYHLYLYSAAGSLLHTFEIDETENTIMYLNDVKITDDGTRMVADFRMDNNPSHMVKAWDLTDYSVIQSFGINNSPVQGDLGLSGDGSILALGDLHGKLRVYRFSGSQY